MLYNQTSPYSKSPLLKPQSEKPIYDIQTTEGSGTFFVDEEITASRQRYLYCIYCGRKCLSKAGKVNHEKSHVRKNRREEISKKSKRARIFTCKECDEEFDQRGALNKHVKIHIKVIKCDKCQFTFKDRLAFEVHDAVYDGEHYDELNMPIHRTRSQSRLSCHSVVKPVRSSSCDTNFNNGAKSSVSDYGSERSTNISRRKRLNSVASSISLSSSIHSSKKSKSIKDWIENNHYMSDDELSDRISIRSFASSSKASSRANTPAARSSMSSRQSEAFSVIDKFICSEANCMKTFSSLYWVTVHEMIEHKKLALFRCKECRQIFTTSDNLQQHRIDKHPNVLICVLCDNAQRGIASIEEHFNLHKKYCEKCEVCGKEFLSKFYLDQHLKHNSDKHKYCVKTKAAILIRIDRKDTKNYLDFNSIPNTYMDDSEEVSFSKLYHCHKPIKSNVYTNFSDHLPWRS